MLSITPASPEVSQPPARSILRDREFRLVLGGQGISAFGDAVSFTALPLLVVMLTGSGVQMGLVGVLQTIPDLLFGLPIGALADRWDRRRMMLYADLGRAILTALIPLSVILAMPTMTVVLLVTAPINLLRVFWLAGWTAALPNLVGRDQVGKAAGYGEMIFSLGFILGPALAGILSALIGPAMTLAIDAASFAVSAVALTFVRRPLQQRTGRISDPMRSEIAAGIRFILASPPLRAAIGFWGAVSVVSAPLTAAVIFYLTLDRGAPPETVGIVITGYSLGYLVGALLVARRSVRRVGATMLIANSVSGCAIVAFAIAPSVPLLLAGAFVTGAAGAFVLISYITLRSTLPPDELLGRVGSTARIISIGLQPIGLLVGGLLLDAVRGAGTMALMGIALLALSAIFLLSRPLREARLPAAGPARPAEA